jgi:hypothetical protein
MRACQCLEQTKPGDFTLTPVCSWSRYRIYFCRLPCAKRNNQSMSSTLLSTRTWTWIAGANLEYSTSSSVVERTTSPHFPEHWYGRRSISQLSRRLLLGSTLRQPCGVLNTHSLVGSTATRQGPVQIAKWSVNKLSARPVFSSAQSETSEHGVTPTRRSSAACFRKRIRGVSGEAKKVCHEPVAVLNLPGIMAAHNMSTTRHCLTMHGKPHHYGRNRPIALCQVDWCISPDASYRNSFPTATSSPILTFCLVASKCNLNT